MSNVVTRRKRPRDDSVGQDNFKGKRKDESLTHDDYTVGWVCALPKELTAAMEMLDQRHPALSKPGNDNNAYTLGSINEHNIVIACLPQGMLGNVSAATVAKSMVTTFPCIKFGLMVGIGGGVPSKRNKIRLGDVVVSSPTAIYPGVVKWDSGKVNGAGKFERTGSLNTPPKSLLTALTLLEAHHNKEESKIPRYLEELKEKSNIFASKFLQTDSLQDLLFRPSYSHVEESALDNDYGDEEENESCRSCDKAMTVKRKPRKLLVHYGLIASGDKLVKDATFRNRLNEDLGGHVLCIEMEAAGLMNEFPCLVIRGICDYADSHKNDRWQGHAAIVAAAFAKELLQYVQASDIEKERPVKDVLEEVQSVLTEIQEDVAQIHSRQTRQEDVTILDWLSPMNYGSEQSEKINIREKGTGYWLIETEEFQTWLSTPGQTLFCRGIPGVGKTILTSIVVDHLISNFRHNSTIGIAYVYCNFRRVEEQTVHQLLASLLKQLAAGLPDLPPEVKSLYTKHQRGRTRPSLQEIIWALNLISARSSRLFVIVDALDETGSSREDFLIELSRLQQQTHINLFTTSRHDTKITNENEELFKNLTKLEIIAAPSDLQAYVKGNLRWLPSSIRNGTTLPQDIVTGIAKSVDGMFLLARIYLNLLSLKVSVTEIRDQLEAFQQYGERRGIGNDGTPLADAYKQTMERINEQQPEHTILAKRVLLWIAFARRELKVIELQHALATGHKSKVVHEKDLPFVDKMVAVCAGLVTIDENTNVIRLVHFTTQEYINQQPGELLPMTEQYITRTCVKYLSFSSFKAFETFETSDVDYEKMEEGFLKQLESYPFYDYAANNWGHHARDSPIPRQELEGLVVEGEVLTSVDLLMVSDCFMDHAPFYDLFTDGPCYSRVTKLHMAVYFGLTDLVEDLLRAGFEIDCMDSHGRTPLSYSAELGWETTVSLLVNARAEVDSQAVISDLNAGRTPLSFAAEAGHEGITQILLKNGASSTLTGSDEVHDETTPLMYAARSGHEGVVRLLLDKYVDLGCQGQNQDLREMCDGSAALAIAVSNNNERIVRLLVQHASNPNVRLKDLGQTPLSLAAKNGNEAIVQLLLARRGVSVDSSNDDGYTALWYAVFRGQMTVIQLLVSGGADVNLGQYPMGSPIVAAAEAGDHVVVQLLLGKGANPDGGVSTDSYNYEVETSYMTLGWNRLTNKESCYRRTPLSYMSEKGHESVVRILLEKGADADSAVTKTRLPKAEDMGRTPLSFAAEKGHEAVVRLLLGREEVDPGSVDYGCRTPLSYAAENGHEAIARLLLERDEVDADSEDWKGMTPLLHSIGGGHETIVRLLLEKEVNAENRYMHVSANERYTPLEYAQMCGHEGIVRVLTETRASHCENE